MRKNIDVRVYLTETEAKALRLIAKEQSDEQGLANMVTVIRTALVATYPQFKQATEQEQE